MSKFLRAHLGFFGRRGSVDTRGRLDPTSIGPTTRNEEKIMLFDRNQFIVDEEGNVKSVVMDIEDYRKIEEFLLDEGLAIAMKESANDEEVDVEEYKRIIAKK